MSVNITCEGAYIVWHWGDREIESPALLRQQLMEIASNGFRGVIGELRATRYDLLDRQVIRTITQVSQWAKHRNITFWFNNDPRMASRQMIAKTAENIQYLVVHPKSRVAEKNAKPEICKIKDNRILLRYQIPERKLTHSIPEIAVHFEPLNLERMFIFQMEKGAIVRETVKDITPYVHFYVNMAKQYIEVYGQIKVPDDETWYGLAFPKYDINIQDYTSRKNNDLMHHYIESIFDEGTYLDGIYWQDPGYPSDAFQFPVSENMYNVFNLELGYDLRDRLFALALPVDDDSHYLVRNNYYRFLNQTIFEAGEELKKSANSFLGQLDFGISYNFAERSCLTESFKPAAISPWMDTSISSVGIGHLGSLNNPEEKLDDLLPQLNAIKSLAVSSQNQEAYASLWLETPSWKNLEYMADILALYSIRWCALGYGYGGYIGENHCDIPDLSKHESWPLFTRLNQKLHKIYEVTGFILPSASIGLIYPIDTLLSLDDSESQRMNQILNRFLSRCAQEGVQLDIISPYQLRNFSIFENRIRIRQRDYQCLVCPFPNILSADLVSFINECIKSEVPLFFAEGKPQILTTGKKVSKTMANAIPRIELNFDALKNHIELPVFKFPENCLTSMIRVHDGELFLFAPKYPLQKFSGSVQYNDLKFEIPESETLTILSHWGGENVQKVM